MTPLGGTPRRRQAWAAHLLLGALALGAPLRDTAAQPAAAAFAWPGGAKAAVSLAYDDALDSQLDVAIPALDKAGLRASFYLTLSSDTVKRRMADWRAAAARGHELANHTLFHQCARSAPGRDWVSADTDLDHTSAVQLAAQIRLGNTLLQALDGRRERTFTAPCGDLQAAGTNYLALIRPDFVAMKTTFKDGVSDPSTLNPYAVDVAAPSNVTGAQLIALVERAAAAGAMANITFHGIGGDYLAVSKQAHDELLAHLSAHRDVYWTDTFVTIMKHVKSRQAGPMPPAAP